ncbi:MAG: magnesium transporter [Acholeplasmatales bacterium]
MKKPLMRFYQNNYITLNEIYDVKEAMNEVVSKTEDATMIDYLYVVDKKNKLLGVIPLKNLIIARAPKKIKNLMLTKYRFLKEETPLYQAIDIIQHYDLEMIPIIDKQGILKGIFTAEDALDLLKEETLEQYRNLAAITEESVDTKAHKKAKSRFPWLFVLMILSIFTSTTVSLFEKTISAVVVLAYFQTMILAMAGNVSTQSLASTVIKATKDPKSKISIHLFKEIVIGFINSLMCALFGFLATYIFLYILKYDNTRILNVSFVVSLSLFISLGIGTLTGAFIPALLKKMSVDPSVASGPFMTTVNDMFSLIVYLGLATILLL